MGSNYICCSEAAYLCGFNGGRPSYATAPTAADTGFTAVFGVATTVRYFFNPNTGTCQAFAYRGGGGNFNNFPTSRDCENFCYQGE